VSHDTALAAERVLLETARAALARGQRATAVDALERHAREFPRGRLGEEREGLWIQALVGAGRVDEARERFRRFRKSYPRSMLIPAFEASLAPDPVTESQRSPQ
jgi:outer membrane protein assembly factor BamD (BamD/ComL family)